MKTTRKLLVLFALAALMIAALVVTTSAYVNNSASNSVYADLKNNSAWVQIAAGSATDQNEDGDCMDEGDLFGSGGSYRAYYNETTKTVSLEAGSVGGTLTASSGDKTNVKLFPYWLAQNAANVEHLQLRNFGYINNLAYVIGSLTSLQSITIEDSCSQWSGTKNDTGAFVGLSSLETVKWGTWNKSTGEFTLSWGEDGVIDLRGFTYLKPVSTIYLDANHMTMYAGSAVRSTAAKKIIMPYQQTLKAPATEKIAVVAVSDGSAKFVEGNPKTTTVGTAFASGKMVYVIQDSEGNLYYTTNNWSFDTGWSKYEVLLSEQSPYYGTYTGIIPYCFARESTSLEEVVIPEEVALELIEGYAFYKCTSLKLIDIKGTVASNMVIESSNAFTNVTDLVIQVYDADSKTNMENALSAANITNVTVTLVGTDDGGEEEEKATMPMGVTNTSDKWLASGYTDVDTEEGWYLIATETADKTTTTTSYPTFAYKGNTRFYWNKTTGKAVWLVLSNQINGDSKQEEEVSGTRNMLEDGVYFTLAWVLNKLAVTDGYVFESVEFRLKSGLTSSVYRTVGLETYVMETKQVLFDSGIKTINFTNTDRGILRYVTNLKTLAHVTYNTDMSGKYTGTVKEGVVDLSGFTAYTPYTKSSVTYVADRMFRDSYGIEEIVWFNTLVSTADSTVDSAGVIDALALYNCTGLKKLTVPATLTAINDRAFRGCKALTTIDLKGGVSSDIVIHSDAFATATQAIEAIVYSSAAKTNLESALTAAGITNVTVTLAVNTPDSANNAITADGYSIRLNDESAKTAGPALRAEFTLLQSAVDAALLEGWELYDYGVVVLSANTYENVYGGDMDALFEAAVSGSDSRIIRKTAYYGPYVSENAAGDKTFAAAITGIDADNYTSAIYTYAYAIWTDDGGETYEYTYTTYKSTRTGKTAHSLYDATVFMFMNGGVNSQNFVMSTGVELWDILGKGAFSITDGEQKAFSSSITTVNTTYTFDSDGKFTYLDLPLYAWKYGNLTSAGAVQWNSIAHSLEETSSTNVLWSLLKDTMADGSYELVAVYRADPNAEGDAVLPLLRDRSYGGYAPFSSSYMTPGKNSSGTVTVIDTAYSTSTNGFCSTQTVHSPILSDANGALVKTLVIDYGVDALNKGALENTTCKNLATMVYPEGVSANTHLLYYNYYVQNVIYASDSKTSLSAEMYADGFGTIADLSGFVTMAANYAFSQARAVENVILPESVTGTDSMEELFYYAYKLKRLWTVGREDIPDDGTIDLTATSIRSFAKNCLANLSTQATVTAPTVIMPASFEGISAYGYKLSEASACPQAFGVDAEYTIILNNANALTGETMGNSSNRSIVAFYENMLAANADLDGSGTIGDKVNIADSNGTIYIVYELTAANADNLDHLTFVCVVDDEERSMTIAEWKDYFDAKKAEEDAALEAITTPLNYYRGVNVNGLEDPDNTTKLAAAPTLLTSNSTYTNIVSQGFDHVRIPVPFHLYYNSSTNAFGKYNYRDYMSTVDTAIDLAIENGLGVILDFHGWYEIDPTDSDDAATFKAIWALVAERYKDYGTELMFELMNEPHYKANTATLINFELEVVDIIRATGGGNERRLILIAGPDSNSPWLINSTSYNGPINLPIDEDPNLILSVHLYDPGEFTHQGCTWAGYEANVQVALTDEHISSIKWNLAQITNFIDRTGVRVMLTETGMNLELADSDDADTYIRLVAQSCDDNNVPLTWWGYDSDTFALYKSGSWKTAVLDALFLR